MNKILEELWNYTNKGKIVDGDFLWFVYNVYKTDLNSYLQKIDCKAEKIDKTKPDYVVPMAYSFGKKEIRVDTLSLMKIYTDIHSVFGTRRFDEFELLLLYNSTILQSLLHELEHAYQFKEACEPDGSLESRLIGLTFYPETKVLTSTLLATLKVLLTKEKLLNIFEQLTDLNNKFDRDVLYERLAQINSYTKVLTILTVIDANYRKIPRLMEYYKNELVESYFKGYDEEERIIPPTYRYLYEVQELGIKDLNKYIKRNIESHYSDAKTVEERIKYGLYVSDTEKESFKSRILG